MSQLFRSSLLLALAMCLASALAVIAKPHTRIVSGSTIASLEDLIPKNFGDWNLEPTIAPMLVTPDVQANLDRIYSAVLSRTYLNSGGQRIMLSIAYGGDQTDTMQVHRPEVCYRAQGFQILGTHKDELRTAHGVLHVTRVIAQQSVRNEPITYWIKVGDEVAKSAFDQKLKQLSYGLTGKIPDGMLVRVSAIDADERRAFALEDGFVRHMLDHMTPEARIRVAGKPEI